jgi:hypothetical protein
MSQPYRKPEIVIPLDVDVRAVRLREAGALPWEKSIMISGTDVPCRKCDSRVGGTRSKICTGSGWLGTLFGGCTLRVEHFHVKCIYCGSKWLMAPADIEM